jgi:hypothetical protein
MIVLADQKAGNRILAQGFGNRRVAPIIAEPPPNPGVCEHDWIQARWMSGHTLDPNSEKEAEIRQPAPIPLVRCLKCGLIRLLVAEDATPPA